MRVIVIEVKADGLLYRIENETDVFRVDRGDELEVHLPAGNKYAQRDSTLIVTHADGSVEELLFQRDQMGAGLATVHMNIAGPSLFHIKSKDLKNESVTFEGPVSTIVVNASLLDPKTQRKIPHTALTILTVISQKLGPLKNWAHLLAPATRQEFNAIHFTPIQVLGESSSSYSLANQLELSSTFECSWSELGAALKNLRGAKSTDAKSADAKSADAKCTEADSSGKMDSTYTSGLLSLVDLVLNHTASNSEFLRSHPECGYNEMNSPWLKGAIELDLAIREFNKKLIDNQFAHKYSITADINTAENLNNLMKAFESECLNPFNLSQYFRIDIPTCLSNFDSATDEHKTCSVSHNPYETAYTLALAHVGETRNGIVLSPVELCTIASHGDAIQRILDHVQDQMWRKKDEIQQTILNSCRGTINYERVECKKGPVSNSPWNSLVPWYFTPVTQNGTTHYLANNGWVMNWKSSEDFAAPGALVYLSRSLCAWSDCVKLRYGRKYDDCPFLYDHMAHYCEMMAEMFDGVRLDNCHSTPLHVGQYLLTKARAKNPNLFVFAELFTGSALDDAQFQRVLGLDALVREAVQTSSPGDLAYHVGKYSLKALGQLPSEPIAVHWNLKDKSLLTAQPAVNILYDCTHDNETPFQKNRVADALACAALVCASACAVGSVLGYERLVQTNPSVLADGTQYKAVRVCESPEEGDSDIPAETETSMKVEYTGHANCVDLWGSFNNWQEGVSMSRVRDDKFEIVLDRTVYGNLQGAECKFVLDKNAWVCSSSLPSRRDGKGNENNVLGMPKKQSHNAPHIDFNSSCGLIEARRILNQVHYRMECGSFTDVKVEYIADDFALISRYSTVSDEVMHIFARSAWWRGPDCPGTRHITLHGRMEEHFMCASMGVDQRLFHQPQVQNNLIGGLYDTNTCVYQLPSPDIHYDAHNDKSYVNFHQFPPGSVCVMLFRSPLPTSTVSTLMAPEKVKAFCADITLDDVNYLLWSAENEERDRSGHSRGVYQFPGMSQAMYAGFSGVVNALTEARRSQKKDEPAGILANIQEGNWLLDYHLDRIRERAHLHKLRNAFEQCSAAIKASSNLKVAAADLLFSSVYRGIINRFYELLPEWISNAYDFLPGQLALGCTQVIGTIKTATIARDLGHTPCMSAGLPFFTHEYMREWGRDTLIAVPGLCIATERYDVGELELLGYARVLRHSMIPNLLDSGHNPRYNARDAVWYWLKCVQEYCKNSPTGTRFLQRKVDRKFPDALPYDAPHIETVEDMIYHILYCHHKGIEYREWNAGYTIDSVMRDEGFNVNVRFDAETGVIVGGNKLNCGTWMDKMGSSEKAGNRGLPASSRDGAPVELTGALFSTLKWIVEELHPNNLFKYNDVEGLSFKSWFELLKENFHKTHAITEADAHKYPNIAIPYTYKDTLHGIANEEDYYLRCNYAVAFHFAPDIAPSDAMAKALDVMYDRLMCDEHQVGIKTLDPANHKFRPNYDNANDSEDKNIAHGWNYHNGPEWVWPFGSWLVARLLVGLRDNESSEVIYHCTSKLQNIRERIAQGPWYSLPEVSDKDGAYCWHSCQAQAWSLATVQWFMYSAQKLGMRDLWISAPAPVEAQVTAPVEAQGTVSAEAQTTGHVDVPVGIAAQEDSSMAAEPLTTVPKEEEAVAESESDEDMESQEDKESQEHEERQEDKENQKEENDEGEDGEETATKQGATEETTAELITVVQTPDAA